VLLLAASLLAVPEQVPAQRTAPKDAPPAFFPSAGPLPSTANSIIAVSGPQAPPPVERIAPLPDDGLQSVMPPPKPAAPASQPAPTPSPKGAIVQALHRPEKPESGVAVVGMEMSGHDGGPEGIVTAGHNGPPPPPAHSKPAPAAPPARNTSFALYGQAALAVDINGPTRIDLGQTLTFDLVVRNLGASTASGVQVEVPLPPGARLLHSDPAAELKGDRLTWYLGDFATRAERHVIVEVQPRDSGAIILRPQACFCSPTGLNVQVMRPPFALALTGPETAATGAKVIFQVQVTNNSTTPITHIVLRDELPAGLQNAQGKIIEAKIETLAPGATWTRPLETTAVGVGRQVNEISACADGGLTARSGTVVLVQEPALRLRVEGPRRAEFSKELTITLKLSNPSRSPSRDIGLALVVPDGLEFAGASTGGAFDPAGHIVRWALGNLDADQPLLVTCKLRPRLPGDWAVAAAARAAGMSEVKSTHAVHLDAVPSLTVELAPQQDPVDVGAETTYVVRIYNQGALTASAVRLTASVPPPLLPVRADGTRAGRVQGQQVLFEELAELKPNVDAVFRIQVRGQQPGQGGFRVQVSAAALPAPLVQEVTAHVRGGPAPQPARGRDEK
jgi:uncharacterized repeat protein (TIGR01451 family)